jgi:hypothetical protein
MNLIDSGYTEMKAETDAKQLADDSLSNYLRFIYRNGSMDSLIAQTRIVASYGLIQLIYYYASIEDDYKIDDLHLPETINVTDTSLTYGLQHLVTRFSENKIKQNFYDSSIWKYGFEETFRRALNRYHGDNAIKGSYGQAVLRNALNYPPKISR